MCCRRQYFVSHSHTYFNSYSTHLVRLSSSKGQLRGDLVTLRQTSVFRRSRKYYGKPQYSNYHHCRIEFIRVYCLLRFHPYIPKTAIRMTDAIRLVMSRSDCLNYPSIYPKTLCRFALSQWFIIVLPIFQGMNKFLMVVC